MPRYIMSHRLAGKHTAEARDRSVDAVERALGGQLFRNASVTGQLSAGSAASAGRRVVSFETDDATLARLRHTLGDDVIVEREIVHSKPSPHPVEFHGLSRPAQPPAAGAATRSLQVTVESDHRPLEGAEVMLALSAAGGGEQHELVTNQAGQVRFDFPASFDPAMLAVGPAAACWSMLIRQPPEPVAATCPPLPPADQHLGWWHRAVGIERFSAGAGEGIRIGVADTGLAAHPDLKQVEDVGAFVDGQHHPDGGGDISNHGTYTCGILAARGDDPAAFGGIAPGAQVFSARVFRTATDATQGDIAAAIHFLVHERSVDLINMSLGGTERSEITLDAITDALEHGALCICAAGNTNGPVSFPGAFPETVAVAALGRRDWGPPGSLAASRVPAQKERIGADQLYLANISAFGAEIGCAAPGVGIIATVPPRAGMKAPYLAMDGTSAASAVVCGALAVLLSNLPAYRGMPRDQTRAAMARHVLATSCRSVGLGATFQGQGVPRV